MLTRKLFRTLLKYKAQFISMAVLIALGSGMFMGFNIEWYSLERDTNEMYSSTGFADYRIYSEKGFSEADLENVLAADGVDDAARFLSINVSVAGTEDTVALTVTENANVSGFLLMEGEEYSPDDPDGIWLSDSYAKANGAGVGDEMTLAYSGMSVTGIVKGLVKSSEYLICLPDDTQLMPDYTTYGFAYISPAMLENAVPKALMGLFGRSMYYQINVKSELSKEEFVKAADEALGETLLVLSKDETVSYAEARGEVNEGKTMGSILPLLFLAIAALTMVTTMHRVTANEKTQIGTLKALGFHDSRIIRHYTCYPLAVGFLGSLLGIGLGYFIGWFIISPGGMMSTYIDMPSWRLYCPWFCWAALAMMDLLLALIGRLSVKRMLAGTAADALRPYTPSKTRHLLIERSRLFSKLSFGTKWNLRDCLRHKSRSLMTLIGVTGCMVLLVGSFGMRDTADAFVDTFFSEANNYTLRVNLDNENADKAGSLALAEELDGDWCAEKSVQIGSRGYSLEIYHIERGKVRFCDLDMNFITLSDDGAYVCARVADEFSLKAGDELTVSPYGTDEKYVLRIAGVVRSMTESVIMTDAYADSAGMDYAPSVIYTDVTDIPADERVKNTLTKKAVLDSFDVFMQIMDTMIYLLAVAAAVLGLVVLYNLGVMSYTERYREMATLKVVGFRDAKIGRLLIGQNMYLTALGIVIGIPAGVAVLGYLLTALAGEYEMKLIIKPGTYLLSVLLTLAVSLIVGVLIARRNGKIDMVAALKTGE